jgi:ATP-dependent exoDNAse (exonuclease V) alpha subunit
MVSEPVVYISNPIFELAEKFIFQTSRSIFLTGKAGTGKTTFLRKIKASTIKNTVIVAPTGVAAINAGGTTIHSFFQLPFTPFIPVSKGTYDKTLSDRYSLLQNLRIESEKRNMFRDLDLLIIDEVSMVRCDVLDSIDVILRHYRRKEHLPFGGVQVLFIGDLFQLPPVVPQQEWMFLQEFYQSPFFFDAQVIREVRPLYIELKMIFRQRDEQFIEILNRVRNSTITQEDLEVLNQRYDPDFIPQDKEKYITLTTHNQKADKINTDELNKLAEPEAFFAASVEGDFPERSFPTDRLLMLKKGAQVMFIKNDVERVRRYYNGKIGTISRVEDGKIFVVFPDEEGELEVEKDSWRNMKYTYNSGNRSIEEEVVGTFTQFPVRLAWAITIHKSQGLTFEKAIIDAGSSFASGQVYVALSRCTTIEGMVLKSKIFRSSVKTDDRILEFSSLELSEEKLQPILSIEKQQYLVDGLLDVFDFSFIREDVAAVRALAEKRKAADKDGIIDMFDAIEDKISQQQEVALKFSNQLKGMVLQQNFDGIRTRVSQAVDYYQNFILQEWIEPLESHLTNVKKKKAKKYATKLAELISLMKSCREVLQRARKLSNNIGEE